MDEGRICVVGLKRWGPVAYLIIYPVRPGNRRRTFLSAQGMSPGCVGEASLSEPVSQFAVCLLRIRWRVNMQAGPSIVFYMILDIRGDAARVGGGLSGCTMTPERRRRLRSGTNATAAAYAATPSTCAGSLIAFLFHFPSLALSNQPLPPWSTKPVHRHLITRLLVSDVVV